MKKILAWFSCGVTSAVAIKIALEKYKEYDFDIIYFKIDSAHQDNIRFIKECEQWYGKEIKQISGKYKDHFDVIDKTRYINGVNGARCSLELKKKLRIQIEKNTNFDYQLFGYEYDKKQINRAIRFIEQNPDAKAIFPLIEERLDKENCLKILQMNNIKVPLMYELGFTNNNCIGCVKGGMGYWNKIRDNFPEEFNKMSEIEQKLKRSCIKNKFLKDLKIDEGRNDSIDLPDCGVFCEVEMIESISPKLQPILDKLNNISSYYKY